MQLNDIYPVVAILLVLSGIGYFLWAMFSKPKTSLFPRANHETGFTTNEGAMGGAIKNTPEQLDEYKAFKLTEAEYASIKIQPK